MVFRWVTLSLRAFGSSGVAEFRALGQIEGSADLGINPVSSCLPWNSLSSFPSLSQMFERFGVGEESAMGVR